MKPSNIGVVLVLLACGIVASAGWLLRRPSPGLAVAGKPLPAAADFRGISGGGAAATGSTPPTVGQTASARPDLPSVQIDRLTDGVDPIPPETGLGESDPADSSNEVSRQVLPSALASPPPAPSSAAPSAMVPAAGLPAVAGGIEIAVAVPPGERAPAVFYDESPRPEPQMRMLDQIAREFNDLVAQPVPGYTSEQIWRAARDWADERYMYLFGWEAWNALHLSAAKEAVREKEAMGQLPQRSFK